MTKDLEAKIDQLEDALRKNTRWSVITLISITAFFTTALIIMIILMTR